MLYLQRETALFHETRPRSILHVAPEACLGGLIEKQQGVTYVRGDRFDPGYAYQRGSPLVRMDLCGLPFRSAAFDVIFCNHVLEHVLNDVGAMRELHRVLKPSGWAVLMVPLSDRAVTYEDPTIIEPAARQAAFGQSDHVRWYGRDYADRLREAGFDVDAVEYATQFSPEEVRHFGLLPGVDDTIVVCRRLIRELK